MIARAWSAWASPDGARAYRAHFDAHVIPALQRLAGHRGALLLQRLDGQEIELVVLTFWDSVAAIRAFTGDDVEVAVVEEEAREALNRYDLRARHFDVVAETRGVDAD